MVAIISLELFVSSGGYYAALDFELDLVSFAFVGVVQDFDLVSQQQETQF